MDMKKTKSIFTLADINWLIDSMKLVFPTRDETITKLDEVNTKLDTFVGDIKGYREEQELNSAKLTNHDDRIGKVEKHLHLPVAP
jgi:hypothetical protein